MAGYYTKPYILEIGSDKRIIYIGGNDEEEIHKHNRWRSIDSKWLRSASIDKVNTWTCYKIFGIERTGYCEVLYIEKSTDGYAKQVIDTLLEIGCSVYVFEYIKETD